MKTKYKYIEFKEQPSHKRWWCWNHKFNQRIGRVEFVVNWKKWEYVPEMGTGYTGDCIRDIADFIDQLDSP